jgi:hypothetical protein
MAQTPHQSANRRIGPAGNTVWDGPDYLAHEGAYQLAERLEAYWRAQGVEITITIVWKDGIACIRSNLVNGNPRSMKEK